MAKANLTYKSERLLGEFLPTVYFKSILIAANESDERAVAQSNLAVKVDASIGFTKPDTMSVTEAREFIKQNLSDLYLYAWVSPFQDVNISLENLNFKIFDLYKQIYNLENPSINNFTTRHLLFNDFHREVKRLYNSQSHPHGGSVTGPFSVEDYKSILEPLAAPTTTILDDSSIGGLLKFGVTVGDANIAAFFAWADAASYAINTANATGDAPFDNTVYRDIYSLDNTGSLISYLVYGFNYNGPWNKARTIHIDSISKIYRTLTKSNIVDKYKTEISPTTLGFEEEAGTVSAGGKTYNSYRDAIDDTVDSSFGIIGDAFETAFPGGFTPLVDGLFTDLGIGVTESSKTTNSYVYDYFSEIMESFSYNYVDFSNAVVQRKKILLSDLISEDNIYGSKLTFNKTFDSDNQEIFKISNINLDFIYNVDVPETDNPVKFATQYINDEVNKLFLISCVGIDTADKIEQLEDDEFMHNINSERNLLNSYFGNITFEEIMKRGVVPRAYFEHYIYTDDGSPFDGIPTEGLDGKLYSDEIVSRDTIINSYKKLIETYRRESQPSSHLVQNMNNLEMLLVKHENSPSLVQKIKLYQKTYSDKRPGSVSGRMYRDFVDLMVKINKSITSQRTVERRVSINSIILDIRPTRVIGNNYLPINPNTVAHLRSHPYNDHPGSPGPFYKLGSINYDHPEKSQQYVKSDFISHKATKLVRNLEFVQLGDDLLLESELTALASTVMDATKYRFTTFRDEVYSVTIDDVHGSEGIPAVGIGAAEVEAAAAELLEDEAERILHYSGVDVSKVNMIVKNKGYFFFDLEKAIHTISRMAHIVDMRKLNIFMNLSIPYRYFYVNKVKLTRWSLGSDFPAENYAGNIHTDPEAAAAAVGIEPTEVWPYMISTCMQSNFKSDNDFPYLNWTYHKVFGSSTINGDELIHYGRPKAELTDATGGSVSSTEYSCIKYVFYDIARNSEPHRHLAEGAVGLDPLSPYAPYRYTPCLKDFGSAEGWPTLTPSSDGFHDKMVTTPGIGQPHMLRKSKSYRMLGFEFTDFMDDDIATLNGATNGTPDAIYVSPGEPGGGFVSGTEARLIALRGVNPELEGNEWYELEITVADKSLRYYRTIYEDIIVPILDVFEEYVDYAEELCSYNTSTDEFNQFFVDAMVEKYITTPRNRYYSEAGLITGQAAAQEATLNLDTTKVAESVIQSSILNSASNLLDLDVLDIPKYIRTIPPWVAGALLKAFIKEIFFNKTPKDSVFSVFYDLVQAFDSYDPELGPPDTETLKFVHEMYNLTPQKGNLPAISAFIEELEPLLKIFRLEDERLKEHLSLITGIDEKDPDFFNKATGAEGETIHTFKQVIQINQPISPGKSRFYLDSISDSYIFGDIDDDSAIPGMHEAATRSSYPGFSTADGYGLRALNVSDFGSFGLFEDYVRNMSEHSSTGILDFLDSTGGGSETNWRTEASGKTHHWLQEHVPDYVDWQQRCKEVHGLTPGFIEEGFIEGKSSQCIYLPPKFNNERIVQFLNLTFHEGTFLPSGVSAGAGGAMAEFLRHFTHIRVQSIDLDASGKPMPIIARWVWYPDPALDDIHEARVHTGIFPGSDGEEIGGITYPEDD